MPTTSSRLLAMLSLLQTRRDWPGGLLADRLDVSDRTVRRDIDRLRELGYPIAAMKGPDGGYRLDAGSQLPPLLFDDDQAVALAVCLQLAAGGTAGAGIAEAAARALATVRQVMPTRLRRRIDSLPVTAAARPSSRPEPRVDSGVLAAIGAVVAACEVLRFDYAPAEFVDTGADGSAGPPRRVEPHHLVLWAGRWYLVAWDLERTDWRTFRVDRMTPKVPTGPRFARREVPGSDVSTFVAGRFRGSTDGSGDWPCHGEVIVDLSAAEVAQYTREAVVEPLGPDRCRLSLGAWSWAGLAASIGRLDAEIEVVGPVELREAFGMLADRYARAAQERPTDQY